MEKPRLRTLAILFSGVSFLALVVCAVAVIALEVTLESKESLVKTYEEVARAAEQLQIASERRARMLRTNTISGAVSNDDSHIEARTNFDRRLAALAKGAGGAQLKEDLQQVREIDAILLIQENALRNLIKSGEEHMTLESKLVRDVLPVREDLDEAVEDVSQHAAWLVALARKDSERTDRLASNVLGGTVILALVVIASLALILRQTLQRVAELQEKLHEATVYQQRLMGVVGHDLRSPLAAILMSARSMPGPDVDPDRFQSARIRIIRSASRMERLAGLLMDVTRVQAALGIPISPQPTDVHKLVGHVVDEIRAEHPDCAILHHTHGDGTSELDDDRIAQVVANLLGNALKYSPADSPVEVTTTSSSNTLEIRIHNNGAIEKELLPRIFEPFMKGDQGQGTSKFSAGLGLYVARQLVEAHGGSIRVTSSEKEGTTFCVRLPRSLDDAEEEAFPGTRRGLG